MTYPEADTPSPARGNDQTEAAPDQPTGPFGRLRPIRIPIVRLLFIAIVLVPTVLAFVYALTTNAPLYSSQAEFSVEDRQQGGGGSNLSGLAASFGIATGGEPNAMYSLRRFLMSPDALRELEKSYGFRDRFRAPNGDMFLRLDATSDNDATLLYYQNRIDVRTSATENIITLNVQAFDPKVAHDMTEHLLVISENFINRMNNRALEDQVAFREAQVAQARDRLRRAQEAVTNWRHNNGVVDPGSQGKLIEGVISGLEVELSRVRADLEQLSTPDNVIQFQPRIKVLHEREAALKAQIEQNRSQLAGRAHSTVTNQLADYESLQADVQYAGKNLEMTMATAESARQDALQQHKYLIRISGPTLPSDRSFPLPGFHTLLTLVATLMLFGIAVLVHSIIRDYRSV